MRATNSSVSNAIFVLTILFAAGCGLKPEEQTSDSLKDFSPVLPRAGTLDPEDLGITKVVYEVKLPAGKALVMRCTKFAPGKPPEVRETIQCNSYRPVREVILVYRSSLFPLASDTNRPSMTVVRVGGDERRLPPGVTCTDVRANDENEPFALYFSNGERWAYKCFIEDYKTVKARIPDLPTLPTNGGGWSFNSNVLHE